MDALPLDTPVRPYNRYSYRFDGDGRTDRASLQPLHVLGRNSNCLGNVGKTGRSLSDEMVEFRGGVGLFGNIMYLCTI